MSKKEVKKQKIRWSELIAIAPQWNRIVKEENKSKKRKKQTKTRKEKNKIRKKQKQKKRKTYMNEKEQY